MRARSKAALQQASSAHRWSLRRQGKGLLEAKRHRQAQVKAKASTAKAVQEPRTQAKVRPLPQPEAAGRARPAKPSVDPRRGEATVQPRASAPGMATRQATVHSRASTPGMATRQATRQLVQPTRPIALGSLWAKRVHQPLQVRVDAAFKNLCGERRSHAGQTPELSKWIDIIAQGKTAVCYEGGVRQEFAHRRPAPVRWHFDTDFARKHPNIVTQIREARAAPWRVSDAPSGSRGKKGDPPCETVRCFADLVTVLAKCRRLRV